MTSLKTKNICFLAAFLFLAIVPTLAEVVGTVKGCDKFLHDETPPHIPGILEGGVSKDQNRYKIICQTYEDGPNPDPNSNQRYLTVYDIENRIPVFSVYEYKGSVRERCDVPWKIEPQLESGVKQNEVYMMKEVTGTKYNNQAVSDDYDGNKDYDKGHLFPANHASTYEEQISTFTLTNAVPQNYNFNRGRWSQMEGNIKKEMYTHIKDNKNRCFVVVGAQPSDNNIPNNNLKNRVNIPSMMWSAFHCTNGVSGAYWDKNIKRDPPVPMVRKTVQQLQDELVRIDSNLQGITVFPQKQPSQKRSSSDSQQPQASKKSLPSSAGKP